MLSPPVGRVSPPGIDGSEWDMVTAEWDFVDTKSDQCPTLFPERPDQTRRTTRKRARQSGRPGGDRRSAAFKQAYVSSMVWQWRRGKSDNLNLFNVSHGQWVKFAQDHQDILEKAYAADAHFAHFTMSGVKYEVAHFPFPHAGVPGQCFGVPALLTQHPVHRCGVPL